MTDWRDDASCTQTDPDLFFDDADESVAAAKAICWSCRALPACTPHALAGGSRHGVQAGLTPAERSERGSKRSAPIAVFVGLNADELRDKWEVEDRRRQKKSEAQRNRRSRLDDDPLADLIHPFDRQERSSR